MIGGGKVPPGSSLTRWCRGTTPRNAGLFSARDNTKKAAGVRPGGRKRQTRRSSSVQAFACRRREKGKQGVQSLGAMGRQLGGEEAPIKLWPGSPSLPAGPVSSRLAIVKVLDGCLSCHGSECGRPPCGFKNYSSYDTSVNARGTGRGETHSCRGGARRTAGWGAVTLASDPYSSSSCLPGVPPQPPTRQEARHGSNGHRRA